MHDTTQEDVLALQQLISNFIQQRLQDKLNKLKPDENAKRAELQQAYQPKDWLDDAAKRAGQIQQVTHAVKYLHPSARGSSFYLPLASTDHKPLLISSLILEANRSEDVVGNAAALDVYKFLCLSYAEYNLLQRAIAHDTVLQNTLQYFAQGNVVLAETWREAFAGLVLPDQQPKSHTLAKQLYWPLADNQYHIIAPLFPTSLVHSIHEKIREDRFSEASKSARAAKREQRGYVHGFCEYPSLAIQKFGGTKPQNVSQLNSERYGENYLLASCPPVWKRQEIKLPVTVTSVFDGWLMRRSELRELLKVLKDFLHKVDSYNNVNIRQTRAELVDEITSAVLLFAAELQQSPAGWTAHDQCQLDAVEQYWLDPTRAVQDAEFAQARTTSAWQHEVCHRFARWVNHALGDLSVGDTEYQEWYNVLEQELRWEL